jgi:hypothetical protein
MKTFTTLTAIAALVAGISIASAQNPGGQAGAGASPSNINKGADPAGTAKSGSESSSTVMQPGRSAKGPVATGNGKFCVQLSKSNTNLNCKFASMDACTKEAQPQGLQCSPNPNQGTTGAK